MVPEWYNWELESKCQDGCLSGSCSTRNIVKTPALGCWRGYRHEMGVVGSPGFTNPIRDLPLLPSRSGDPRLVEVMLAGGLRVPQSHSAIVATPQFSALRTNLERTIVIRVGINGCIRARSQSQSERSESQNERGKRKESSKNNHDGSEWEDCRILSPYQCPQGGSCHCSLFYGKLPTQA